MLAQYVGAFYHTCKDKNEVWSWVTSKISTFEARECQQACQTSPFDTVMFPPWWWSTRTSAPWDETEQLACVHTSLGAAGEREWKFSLEDGRMTSA